MLGTYTDYIKQKQREYKKKFDASELDSKFVPAYNDKQRIRVKFPWGEVKTGTVGVTTGWKPHFLLMIRSNHIGSSYLLRKNVIFTKEKCTVREK